MPSVAGSTPRESSTARDGALAELVEGYLARLQAGEAIDPNAFLAKHPEHAERLARIFHTSFGMRYGAMALLLVGYRLATTEHPQSARPPL
jgi:hypothetical protein